MSNTGKYMKPARCVSTPGVVFTVDVKTKPVVTDFPHAYAETEFSYAYATVVRKRRGRWSRPEAIRFTSPSDLHYWIMDSAEYKRRNYIICNCASDVLTLTRFWTYAERKGIAFVSDKIRKVHAATDADFPSLIDIRRCVLRGTMDILDYSHYDKRYLWLSHSQYFSIGERELAKSIGYNPPMEEGSSEVEEDRVFTPEQRVILLSMAYCTLSNWWVENSAAPWGLTIGQLATGVLRSHVEPKTLCTHKNTDAHKLERYSCFGGRASVFYVGNIVSSVGDGVNMVAGSNGAGDNSLCGPITHIDIRSMYPTLLRDQTYPCRLIKTVGETSVEKLRDLLDIYGAIADVTIRSESAEYPYRLNGEVIYPRGVFRTVLAAPDLQSISDPDSIISVHAVAVYATGRPFERAAHELLKMRVDARRDNNPAWELLAKTLANSMGGKLAQRQGQWKDRRDMVPERQWGEWRSINADTKEVSRYRSIAGMVSQYLVDSSGAGPHTSAFCYLTSYGRQLMRRIRASALPHTVVSQDTDGLWVLGHDSLESIRHSFAFGESPGELSIKEVSASGRWFGPKHYLTDSCVVLSGFHNPQLSQSELRISDTYRYNPILRGCTQLPQTIRVVKRESTLTLSLGGGLVGYDGWVFPPYISPPIIDE